MAAEVTAIVDYGVTPFINCKTLVVTYSKAGATDYLTLTTYGIKTVRYATAKITATGADDPCTWATSVVTFTTGTGAGACLVAGTS